MTDLYKMTDLENKAESLDVDVKSDCKSLDLDIKLEDDIFGGHHVPIDDTTTEIDSIYHYSALMLKAAIRQATTVQDINDAFQIVPEYLIDDTIGYINSPVVDALRKFFPVPEKNSKINSIYDLLRYASGLTDSVQTVKFLLSKTELDFDAKSKLVSLTMTAGNGNLVIYYLSVFGVEHAEHTYQALCEGHKDLVRFILDNYEVSEVQKNVMIVQAARRGYLDMVQFLVEKGADIRYRVYETFTGAITSGNLTLVKFLVDNGIIISRGNITEYLVKSLRSSQRNNTDIYEYLISLKIATLDMIIEAGDHVYY